MKLSVALLSLLIPVVASAGGSEQSGAEQEIQRKLGLVQESSVLKNLVDTIEREHSVYCDAYTIELVGDEHFTAKSVCRNNDGWKLKISARGTFVEEMPAMVDGVEMSYGFQR